MRLYCVLLGMASLLWAGIASAAQVDLSLSAIVTPARPHAPGQSVTVTFTLTNLGPDATTIPPNPILSAVRASAQVREINGVLPVEFFPQTPTACVFEPIPLDPPPGQAAGIIFVVYFPALAAGASQTCSVTGVISPTATSDIVTRWNASSLGDVEREPLNNSVDVVFGLSPITVPALSLPGMAVLLCGVLLVVLARIRKVSWLVDGSS